MNNRKRLLGIFLSAFILVVALSIFTLDTVFSARNEFRPVELDYIRTAFLACSSALIAMVVVANLLPSKLAIAARALTGVLFAAAVFSINWSMVEAFVLLPMIAMAGLCLLAIYLTYIVLSLGVRGRAIVAVIVAVIFILVPGRDMLDANEEAENTEFPGIEDITFDTKPKRYFMISRKRTRIAMLFGTIKQNEFWRRPRRPLCSSSSSS